MMCIILKVGFVKSSHGGEEFDMNKSFEIIKKDLLEIGLVSGDTVIVHSSLSSMGNVEGGAETVIAALMEVIGPEGTLMFPAFTYKSAYLGEPFVHDETPVCVGLIPETFRKWPGVIRSVHPSHSVSAIGRLAYELTKDHALDETPMGLNSPYRRLAEHKAKILMLGCSLNTMSYMHALEEEAEAEYCLTPNYVEYTITDDKGVRYTKKYRKHNFRRPTETIKQCYARLINILTPESDYIARKIHGATSYLVDAVALHDKALLKFKESPYYFVDAPGHENHQL